jgi:hypothetical protein
VLRHAHEEFSVQECHIVQCAVLLLQALIMVQPGLYVRRSLVTGNAACVLLVRLHPALCCLHHATDVGGFRPAYAMPPGMLYDRHLEAGMLVFHSLLYIVTSVKVKR